MFLLLLLSAFEFPGCSGRSSAMLAGAAVADGQHSFSLNPALVVSESRYLAGACYSQPYGLSGLAWGKAGVIWSSGRLATGAVLSILSLGRYCEQDAGVVVGGALTPGVAVGLGAHMLVVRAGEGDGDMVPSIDAGACWRAGRLRIGAAGLRLNRPRWHEGTELPLRVVLAGSLNPVDDVLLALDIGREGGEEDAAFGLEFRLVPRLGLRTGVGVAPLRYAAGLGAEAGPVGFEYAYQFHPQLKETHLFGLRAAWH